VTRCGTTPNHTRPDAARHAPTTQQPRTSDGASRTAGGRLERDELPAGPVDLGRSGTTLSSCCLKATGNRPNCLNQDRARGASAAPRTPIVQKQETPNDTKFSGESELGTQCRAERVRCNALLGGFCDARPRCERGPPTSPGSGSSATYEGGNEARRVFSSAGTVDTTRLEPAPRLSRVPVGRPVEE